jgi:hypothetical protein
VLRATHHRDVLSTLDQVASPLLRFIEQISSYNTDLDEVDPTVQRLFPLYWVSRYIVFPLLFEECMRNVSEGIWSF